MSGQAVYRQQPSTAVWGGVTGGPNAPTTPGQSSGWLVARRQPSIAVWGGIAAVSNVPLVPPGVLVTGDYDGKSWWKKRWILGM